MSDFTAAVARVSEGFCPIHGVGLRPVSDEWFGSFCMRHAIVVAPLASEVGQCGMCPGGRVWWTDRVDITTHESEKPEQTVWLRSAPELDDDERRFIYDRGDAGDGGPAPR